MTRLSVAGLTRMVGSWEVLIAKVGTLLRCVPHSRCSVVWKGKAYGGSPRFLSGGDGPYGVDARELLWCLTFKHDRIPEEGWVYRLCDRPRCMDMEHVFVGPPGLSRTLGRMKKDKFPVGLFVLNGLWRPDAELLSEYRRTAKNQRAVASRRRTGLSRLQNLASRT